VPGCLQDAENNWGFDIFGFADATPGYSLSLLYCHFIKRAGLMQGLEEVKFIKYARRIEKGYIAANPYHNRSAKALRHDLPHDYTHLSLT